MTKLKVYIDFLITIVPKVQLCFPFSVVLKTFNNFLHDPNKIKSKTLKTQIFFSQDLLALKQETKLELQQNIYTSFQICSKTNKLS